MATAWRWLLQTHYMTRNLLRLGLALAFFGAIEDHEYQILWQALWRQSAEHALHGAGVVCPKWRLPRLWVRDAFAAQDRIIHDYGDIAIRVMALRRPLCFDHALDLLRHRAD